MKNTGRHGVAIALSKAAQAAILVWAPIPSRLSSTILKGATVSHNIVAVDDPKLDAEGEAKDCFFDEPQDAIVSVPSGDF